MTDLFPEQPTPVYGGFREDNVVEEPALYLLGTQGWETADLSAEWAGGQSSAGRRTKKQAFLPPRLDAAIRKLNPDLPGDAVAEVVEELTRDRTKLVPAAANQEVYGLLKDGVKVEVRDATDRLRTVTARVIDWQNPEANDFFAVRQFSVQGEIYGTRADMVGFVNGLPLVLFEFKRPSEPLRSALDDNIKHYREAVPQLFPFNAFVVVSNGSEARLGSFTAEWEHVFHWKRVDEESETGSVRQETLIRGTCERARLLDIIENFTVFEKAKGGLIKKIGKNHQVLGVNRAIAELANVQQRPQGEAGRLGVFWHTQGSGKSLSMVFFCQKILRKVAGNWTFVIVTDRQELDTQIYRTFAATDAVKDNQTVATSGAHLQELLKLNHRYVFTLIQKFQTERGETYPKLSDRRDVIVITDEAHRSQYDTLALNMRNALPQAAFIGFTGTPLIAGEERTREVFGDYVSRYDFGRSVADGATVPLYYENRIPELQLDNDDFADELAEIVDDAELDEAQEEKLQRQFARQYHLVVREERLEAIADDVVQHFMGRGFRGKAMFVAIDKATAVRMYEKVRAKWNAEIRKRRDELDALEGDELKAAEAQLKDMRELDMAVVVSQSQNEKELLVQQGLDIIPHRKRMKDEALDEKFKDANDPLRLVFVCAMWITGFDVPSCSTIYLDKPLKNHTLMQTIARANRVYPGKAAGLIVDYFGVFRNLKDALAIYGGGANGASPIENKSELVAHLRRLVVEAKMFCARHGIDIDAIKAMADWPAKSDAVDDAVEELLETQDVKKEYLTAARVVARLYKAVLPDPAANEVAHDVVILAEVAKRIRARTDPVDISGVMREVEDLLDRSIAPVPYILPPDQDETELFDLNRIDFDKLKEQFEKGRKRTEAERLRALLDLKLDSMVKQNPTRREMLERFQYLIARYNEGSVNIEAFFAELLKMTTELSEEDQRAAREGLSEEELAVFDILTRPGPKLTEAERTRVKKVCRDLLQSLQADKLVPNWRLKPQSRGQVEVAIKTIFDDGLPEAYDEATYEAKVSDTFHHVFERYDGHATGSA
ncbi:type I restriction endonuclease subunit R [Afifella sp. H1R]|uniref:type I restriction endonuclease subunit R n=1 Tax=Afifella sp. H1R TaxID=2908841 RepID=UPI001F26827E|nr:type I restriction endonuclease subunit R [Afifella sp. H1R]MCF1504026.1 type I restriction endonuclease subunit R [Afifella sp. H1R]